MGPANNLLDESEEYTTEVVFYRLTKDGYEAVKLSSKLDIVGVNFFNPRLILLEFNMSDIFCYEVKRTKKNQEV
ncbi:MAG: hypothetical protein AB7V16_10025 [Vulcanibacillus sp.]